MELFYDLCSNKYLGTCVSIIGGLMIFSTAQNGGLLNNTKDLNVINAAIGGVALSVFFALDEALNYFNFSLRGCQVLSLAGLSVTFLSLVVATWNGNVAATTAITVSALALSLFRIGLDIYPLTEIGAEQ